MKKGLFGKLASLFIVMGSYLFLYLPILILIIFSFNTKSFPSPWDQFTFKWYHELFNSSAIWRSFTNSLIVACISTTLSLLMGIFLIFFRAQGGRIQKALPLFYGNLIIPETMLAISLLSYFTLFKIELGMPTLIVAHTVLGLGFVIPILYTRYLQLDRRLTEASEVLGAAPFQTFIKITLPLLRPTLLATGLLIFILSFDDFILSYFCAGTSVQTLSLYLLSMLRSGISPIVNALSTILLLLSSLMVMLFFSPKIRSRIL
ncbi:MAG: ABC transporter permease subunit [Chlamydiales bacterium]|nr:ABC transporter permease subunit [Chlamydiia bacterium]MCP5504778.1 ABC transporter permease subunit [Chlamydiales bacterium]